MTTFLILLFFSIFLFPGCNEEPNFVQSGKASFYSDKFEGELTTSEEVFSQDKMTAAHKHLPMGTKIKVLNEEQENSVEVRINDRGPFAEGRIIDLSKKAWERLGLDEDDGLAQVTIKARIDEEKARSLKEELESVK